MRVRQGLNSAIELTRRITEQLRPALLDNVGLFSALRWLLKNACSKSSVRCSDNLPSNEPQLTSAGSIALFRSVQEALIIGLERNDVAAVALAGKIDDGELSIQIMADGTALLEEARGLRALMFESIRHRIRALGGVVDLEHPTDGGIVLGMSTPLANIVTPHSHSATRAAVGTL